jgi:putative ABC transport system ATP-binding protein
VTPTDAVALQEAAGPAPVLELLRELHEEATTIWVITHDHMAAASDRRVEIRDGKIVHDSPA